MTEIFTSTLVDLDNFLTFMVRQMFQSGEPTKCTYRSIGRFDPDSVEIPSASELIGYVNDAFAEPQIEVYLEKVQDLPESNIFSTTSYISMDGSSMISTKKKGRGTIISAVAGASFTLLVGGLMVLSSRNNRKARFDTQSVIDKLNNDLSTLDMGMEEISLDEGGVNKKMEVIDVIGY